MPRILPDIDNLTQHLRLLIIEPERYRPACCLLCNSPFPWAHGSYLRYPDRKSPSKDSLNPIPIPRYLCSDCGKTFSCLPMCIPPRRWYLWKVQQEVLMLVIQGVSFSKIEEACLPSRVTVSRWWQWLKSMFASHRLHLCAQYPDLGYHDSLPSFWLACLGRMTLAEAMLCICQAGEVVP